MPIFRRTDRGSTVASATFIGRRSLSSVSSAYYGLTKTNTLSYLITGQDIAQDNYLISWRSDYTQLIANNLQYWNAIRNYPNSTGQLFINSMACEIDNLYSYWRSTRKKLWLETADTSEPYLMVRMSLPDHVAISSQPTKNLLFNGGFDLRSSAIFNQPDGWSDLFTYTTGVVSLYENDSVSSGPSTRIYAAPGQRCYLGQKVETTLGKGNSVVLSAWYKTPVNTRADANLNIPGLRMVLKVLKDDGTYDISSKELRIGTSLKWLRDWIKLDLTSDARAFVVSFEINNTSAENIDYYIDSVQLEIGNYPTEFRRNSSDMPEHMRTLSTYPRSVFEVESWLPSYHRTGNSIAGYHCTGSENKKIANYQVLSQNTLRDQYVCPTAITVTTGTTGLTSIASSLNGLVTNNIEYNPYEKYWVIRGGTNFGTYPWPYSDDVTGNHYISNRNVVKKSLLEKQIFNQEEAYQTYTDCKNDSFMQGLSYDIEIEGFTISEEKIWAVCKESYTGITQRVLKIMYPRYFGETGSLQCIADFRLPELGTGGTVSSVGFLESDKTKLVVSMTGTIPATLSGSTINLKHDYFWIDGSRRQVFLRDTSEDRTVIIL